MKNNVWQLQEAKSKFSQLVDQVVDNEPQFVTRHSNNTVVIVSIDAYEKVQKSRLRLWVENDLKKRFENRILLIDTAVTEQWGRKQGLAEKSGHTMLFTGGANILRSRHTLPTTGFLKYKLLEKNSHCLRHSPGSHKNGSSSPRCPSRR